MKTAILSLALALSAFAQQSIRPNISAEITNSATPWTSSTVVGTAAQLQAQTQGYTTALISLVQSSGTFAQGGSIIFEGSDTPNPSASENWFSVACAAPGTSGSTYTLQSNTNIGFRCNVVAYQRFRVRLLAAIAGTGSATVGLQFASLGNPDAPSPAPVTPSAGVSTSGLISSTYLGSGSANTAKTTGNVTLTTAANATMGLIYAVGCSGNFATSNWAAAVTDSAANTYVQLGASSGTYPQANSTTQVCVPFVARNASPVTTINFTISGSSSSNTTVTVMAWGIINSLGSLAAVDGWSAGTSSGATAISSSVLIPSQSNELIIAAGGAASGTISLTTGSGLTFDSGSTTIASGSNIASIFGGSAVVGQPVGVTGAFTNGSSVAFSEVVVAFRGYPLTDAGLQHLTGNMLIQQSRNNYFNLNPVLTTPPPMWAQTSNPGSAATATTAVAGIAGKIRVVTGWCFGMGVGTTALGATTSETFTVVDSSAGTFFSATLTLPTTVATMDMPPCVTGVAIPITAGQAVTAAFGGNLTNLNEWVSIFGYDVAVTGVVF